MEHYRKDEGEMERGRDGGTGRGKRQRERDGNKLIHLSQPPAYFPTLCRSRSQIPPVVESPIKWGDHRRRMAGFHSIITERDRSNTNEGLIIGLMN